MASPRVPVGTLIGDRKIVARCADGYVVADVDTGELRGVMESTVRKWIRNATQSEIAAVPEFSA